MVIRVGVIDRRTLVRESVGRLLAREPDLQIVGCWASVEAAVGALSARPADVVIVAYDPAVDRGGPFLRETQPLAAQTHVLVSAEHPVDERDVAALIRIGVIGVIDGQAPVVDLCERIRRAYAGREQFDPAYLRAIIATIADRPRTIGFTERERQVLRCVGDGLTNRAIAARLRVSEGSVKAVLQQLFAKVGVRRRSQLVGKALAAVDLDRS
jgi:DNA-binding NarL/FixJ family response regulator